MILTEWLEKIQKLHVTEMDLSLERVAETAKRLGVKANCTVISVGGTNGKGSCVAALEKIYLEAGYRVGAFTSPILFKHNEYIRIQRTDIDDESLCDAFEKIDYARGDISLTPFEFTALAAFYIFQKQNLDVWILEVGLGGRYDAVNIIDADLAIVASIGLDHTEWLGDTREKIAIEKAGIFRLGKPAVCGDFFPPETLITEALKKNARLYLQGKDFQFEKSHTSWDWSSQTTQLKQLPLSVLALQNMATVLMAVELLQNVLNVSENAIRVALQTVTLPGRIQVVAGKVTTIFDVSHNPAAAEFLATWLKENKNKGKTRAVFSMLADKDISGTLAVMKEHIDEWFYAALPVKRGAPLETLKNNFEKAGIETPQEFSSIRLAFEKAHNDSSTGDRVIVFGSFHTVTSCY